MQVTEGPLAGLLIITPRLFHDERGVFFEAFNQARYQALGIPAFVQDNHSRSQQHVLRGLHYQLPNPQGKLVFVTRGEVWDVVVDLRRSSPTFGQWFGITLNDITHTQLYIPPGFAHGFCTRSETADFAYKCTDFYTPGTERGLAYNDATLDIPWKVENPILSPKDQTYPNLKDISPDVLFP